jgi:hypothetical protein
MLATFIISSAFRIDDTRSARHLLVTGPVINVKSTHENPLHCVSHLSF